MYLESPERFQKLLHPPGKGRSRPPMGESKRTGHWRQGGRCNVTDQGKVEDIILQVEKRERDIEDSFKMSSLWLRGIQKR